MDIRKNKTIFTEQFKTNTMTIKNSKEFREQINTLLVALDTNKTILDLAEKAYNSGGMETECIESNDFSTAKAVLCAIFDKMSNDIKPFSSEFRKTAENLKKII